jgi:hypothetical protein
LISSAFRHRHRRNDAVRCARRLSAFTQKSNRHQFWLCTEEQPNEDFSPRLIRLELEVQRISIRLPYGRRKYQTTPTYPHRLAQPTLKYFFMTHAISAQFCAYSS